MAAIISEVKQGSIAHQLDIMQGDKIISINEAVCNDLIDYQFQIADEFLEVTVEKKDGEVWILEIEKEIDEDLGIVFESAVFDKIRPCQNKCVFCFVDQMPLNMRKSLYVKDDDYRLSFLQGNFITLTNLKEEDIQRIIKMRLSPLYISIHAFDEEVRIKTINNKKGAEGLSILKRLVEAGIHIHGQIVLVPQLNDGVILEKTIDILGAMHPQVMSLAVVPVGLTKYRDKLAPLRTFKKHEAKAALAIIKDRQEKFIATKNTRFVFASDELYFLAGEEIPEFYYYENFTQLENGVGLTRLFWHDSKKSLDQYAPDISRQELDCEFLLITGQSGAKVLKPVVEHITKTTQLQIKILPVQNNWFGTSITVTGLLTATDILAELNKHNLDNKVVIIPDVVLRKGDPVFLDDVTVDDFRKEVTAPVVFVQTTGVGLIEGLLAYKGEIK